MKPQELYILKQSEKHREILYFIMTIIEREHPDALLLYKWNIPYYYIGKKPFCFLNVVVKNNYIDLAFNYFGEASVYDKILISEKRKWFKSLRFFELASHKVETITNVLKENRSKFI
jgi:Domain of unknown function (DU1801)